MKIKWLRVVRDAVIVTVFLVIGGFIVGSTGIVTIQSLTVSSLFLGTLGFCLCGCLTIENRWKHLFILALGVWLINCLPQLPSLPFSVLAWVLNVGIVFVPMIIGGALSSGLARTPKQKDEHDEQKQNSNIAL